MKRLHINLQVKDLATAIDQYALMLGEQPTFRKDDYAKWDLDEPQLSLSVSARGLGEGLDHLGIKFDNMDEFREVAARIAAANGETRSEESTTCCYARSDKEWWRDPVGLNWELFVTHEQVDEFGGDVSSSKAGSATGKSRRNACC